LFPKVGKKEKFLKELTRALRESASYPQPVVPLRRDGNWQVIESATRTVSATAYYLHGPVAKVDNLYLKYPPFAWLTLAKIAHKRPQQQRFSRKPSQKPNSLRVKCQH